MENNYNVQPNEYTVDGTAPAPKRKNVAAIVLGIVSLDMSVSCLILSWIPIYGFIGMFVGIAGIITGAISKKKDNRVKMGKIGLILSIIGVVLSVLFTILGVVLLVLGLTDGIPALSEALGNLV